MKQTIPNWPMPTLKPLETRWNEAENCFEVDWEESRFRQAQESLAAEMKRNIEQLENVVWSRIVNNHK